MKLSKQTTDILKNFAVINTNIVVQPGKKFSTMSSAKDIMAEFEGDDSFDKKVCIFNLGEMLGVYSAFGDPEIDLDDEYMTIKEGKQKVKYMYAAESLLTTPTKEIKMPDADVTFTLTADQLSKLQKMASVLSVDDLTFVGNGKKIVAKVHDVKNSTGNSFDIDLDAKTDKKFEIHFKVEKIFKLFDGDYDVEISSKGISKFNHKNLKLKVFIAVESDSKFV